MRKFVLVMIMFSLLLIGFSSHKNDPVADSDPVSEQASFSNSTSSGVFQITTQSRASHDTKDSAAPIETSQKLLDEIAPIVCDLRGLVPTGDIECVLIPNDGFSSELGHLFNEEFPKDEVAARQEVYEMLGLIENDMNLYDIMHSIYSSGIRGI